MQMLFGFKNCEVYRVDGAGYREWVGFWVGTNDCNGRRRVERPCVGRKSHILRWFYEEVLQRFYLYVNWRYATSLSYEFAEKFLNDSPKSLDELLDALILYRKDFNAKYVAKVAERLSEVGAVKGGRKKLSKKTKDRIRYFKKGVFNWDDEIDFQAVFESNTPVEEDDERNVDAYNDEEEFYSRYDRELEAQVITPPAWYIEKVWGEYKLPGIHLPADMWDRYLSIYEKKLIRGR